MEVGDLSCREIKPGGAVIDLFSHRGDANKAGKEALKRLLDKLHVSALSIGIACSATCKFRKLGFIENRITRTPVCFRQPELDKSGVVESLRRQAP